MQATRGTTIASEKRRPASIIFFRLLAIGIALFGLLLDLGTKELALAQLDPDQPISLLGGLVSLHLIRNPGAAFGMGEEFTLILAGIAIAAFVAVCIFLLPRVRHTGWAVTTGVLLAGICGNLADRLFREPSPFYGHVIDFIQVPYFAIFNVADICITAAAILLIWLTAIAQINPSGVSQKDSASE